MSQKQAKRLKSHENSLGSLVIIFCKHTFIMISKFHWIGSCVKIFWKDTGKILSQSQSRKQYRLQIVLNSTFMNKVSSVSTKNDDDKTKPSFVVWPTIKCLSYNIETNTIFSFDLWSKQKLLLNGCIILMEPRLYLLNTE